jgi:hypothetical protein
MKKQSDPQQKFWLTDEELISRWQCSRMTLWRMRRAKKLSKARKIGGLTRNLTSLAEVEALEAR